MKTQIMIPAGLLSVVVQTACGPEPLDEVSAEATSGAYCAASARYTSYEWIEAVRLDNFSNRVESGAGYEDFTEDATGQVVSVSSGGTLSATLGPGYSGHAYREYWAVWVDGNQDGDFDDPGEELFRSSNSSNQAINTNLTLPSFTGKTQLRVRMWYSGSAFPGPCGSTTYGQVEDYTLDAGGAPPTGQIIRVVGGTYFRNVPPSSLYTLTVSDLQSTVELVTQDGLTGTLSGTLTFTDRFLPTSTFLPSVPTENTITIDIPPMPYEYNAALDGWYLVGHPAHLPATITQHTVADDGRTTSMTVSQPTWTLSIGNIYGMNFNTRSMNESLRQFAVIYDFNLVVEGF